MSKLLYDRSWSFLPGEPALERSLEILYGIRKEYPEFEEKGVNLKYSLREWGDGGATLTIQFAEGRMAEPNDKHMLGNLLVWLGFSFIIAYLCVR